MIKKRSGLRSWVRVPGGAAGGGNANDRDYDAGGSGLLGSRAFNSLKEAEDHFGVKYDSEYSWSQTYDNDASKGMFKDWYDSTTAEERDGCITYTGGAYSTINKYLREGTLDSAPQWVKDAVRNSDKAMDKFVLKEAITVWRGGSNRLIGGARTVDDINAMKGAIVVDKGITSTAVTRDGAWYGMKYEIVYPKGRGRGIFIDPISAHHGEKEFMARRGTRYEVIGGYNDYDGNTVCQLKAVYGRRSRK